MRTETRQSPTPSSAERAMHFLGASVVLSFGAAILFVTVMTLTLPKTDMAHGQLPFQDPLVFPVMCIGAIVVAIVGWPVFMWIGWRASIGSLVQIIAASAFSWILLVTPFAPGLGLVGSVLISLVALIWSARYRCGRSVTTR